MTAKTTKETAEQKLLRMIESSSTAAATAKTQQKVVKKQTLLTVVRLANQLLLVVILVLGAYFVFEIIKGTALLTKKIEFNTDGTVKGLPGATDPIGDGQQRLSYYLASVKKRNVFQPYEGTAQVAEVVSSKLTQKTGHLKLVGISWMNSVDTASAMIEDSNKKVTLFLNRGDKIDDIIVKTIYADSVKLGYDNEEIILNYDKPQM